MDLFENDFSKIDEIPISLPSEVLEIISTLSIKQD